MRKLFTTKRALRTAMLSAVLAFPLLGAGECSDITGSDDSSSSSYDGTYDLVSVDGKSASSYDIIRVDANNRLVLYRGVWTLSGRTLTTEMSTYSIVNGVRKDDPKFQPERHTGTVTIEGNVAKGTLNDTGSFVTATFDSGTLLTSNSGHQMKFAKR